MSTPNMFSRFVSRGGGVTLLLALVLFATDSKAGFFFPTVTYDTIRAKVASDTASIMIIAHNGNSSTIYISTNYTTLQGSDLNGIGFLDTNITKQINSDSLSFQIPSSGSPFWLVPFDGHFPSHPYSLSFGGTGFFKCNCNFIRSSTCSANCITILSWMGLTTFCYCNGFCSTDDQCDRTGSVFHGKDGPFAYDNSAVIISADTIVYNGVPYSN